MYLEVGTTYIIYTCLRCSNQILLNFLLFTLILECIMSLIVYAMRRWLWAWNRGMHPVQLRVATPLLRLVWEIICIAQLSYGVVL